MPEFRNLSNQYAICFQFLSNFDVYVYVLIWYFANI